MRTRSGFIGMQVSLLIKLVVVILFLAALGWGALQIDIGGFQEGQEIRSFVGDVEYRCDASGSDAQEDVSRSVPRSIQSIEIVEGNVVEATLEGGETVEVESSACDELVICVEEDSGAQCEAGGVLQPRDLREGYVLRYDVWYPGDNKAVIDPLR